MGLGPGSDWFARFFMPAVFGRDRDCGPVARAVGSCRCCCRAACPCCGSPSYAMSIAVGNSVRCPLPVGVARRMVEVEAGRVFPVAFAAVGAPVLPLLGDVRPYVLPVERSLLVLRSLDRRVQDFLRVELRGLHDGAAGAGPLGEPVQPVLLVRDDAFDGGRDPFGRARAVLEPGRSDLVPRRRRRCPLCSCRRRPMSVRCSTSSW